MEPDDTHPTGEPEESPVPLQDFLGIGAGVQPAPPGPDDLRAIVARAGRRRRRVTAAGVVVALAAGAGVGYVVSNHGSPSVQTASPAARSSSSTTVAGGSLSVGPMSTANVGAVPAIGVPPIAYPTLTPIFNRTTDGITIRGFLSNVSLPRVSLVPRCGRIVGSGFQAEVSTAKMVGTVAGGILPPVPSSSAVVSAGAELVGVAEGDPTAVVTVQTSSAVTRVRIVFAGGASDEMAPVKGWAALAASAPGVARTSKQSGAGPVAGTLTAYNGAGHVLSTSSVSLFPQIFGGVAGSAMGSAIASPACGICPHPPIKLPAGATSGSSVNPGGPMITDTTIPAAKRPSGHAAVGSVPCASFAPPVPVPSTGGSASGSSGSSAGGSATTGTVTPTNSAGATG